LAFFYTITPSKERHSSTPEQQNIDLIKGLYEAFGKGDIDPIIDHLAGHFVWRFDAPPTIPFAGDYKTPIRSSPWFFGSLAETQTDRVLNPEWRYHHHKHVFIRIGPVTIEKEH
jgi:hypothetical protein